MSTPILRWVAWKADGSYALITGADGSVYRYPAENGQLCIELVKQLAQGKYLECVDWFGDLTIIVGGNRGEGEKALVFKFNPSTKQETRLWPDDIDSDPDQWNDAKFGIKRLKKR